MARAVRPRHHQGALFGTPRPARTLKLPSQPTPSSRPPLPRGRKTHVFRPLPLPIAPCLLLLLCLAAFLSANPLHCAAFYCPFANPPLLDKSAQILNPLPLPRASIPPVPQSVEPTCVVLVRTNMPHPSIPNPTAIATGLFLTTSSAPPSPITHPVWMAVLLSPVYREDRCASIAWVTQSYIRVPVPGGIRNGPVVWLTPAGLLLPRSLCWLGHLTSAPYARGSPPLYITYAAHTGTGTCSISSHTPPFLTLTCTYRNSMTRLRSGRATAPAISRANRSGPTTTDSPSPSPAATHRLVQAAPHCQQDNCTPSSPVPDSSRSAALSDLENAGLRNSPSARAHAPTRQNRREGRPPSTGHLPLSQSVTRNTTSSISVPEDNSRALAFPSKGDKCPTSLAARPHRATTSKGEATAPPGNTTLPPPPRRTAAALRLSPP